MMTVEIRSRSITLNVVVVFRFYPLHFPKKDTVTELHEFGNGIML